MGSNYNEDVVLMNPPQAPRGLPADSADPGRDPRHGHLQPARPRRQEDQCRKVRLKVSSKYFLMSSKGRVQKKKVWKFP